MRFLVASDKEAGMSSDLPFTVEPYWVPPEHLACYSCLDDMLVFFRIGEVSATLARLFNGAGVGNGDPWPWELCRWSKRCIVVDDNDQHWLRDEDHPEVKPDDFLACCDPDPGCFGPDNFWNTYSEDEFRRILEHAFSVWARERPHRVAEFAAALQEHGMKLVPV